MEDILTVLPFQNYIDVITVTGGVLLKALEHAVAKYDHDSPRGEFLQVAGELDVPVTTFALKILLRFDIYFLITPRFYVQNHFALVNRFTTLFVHNSCA